MKSKLWRTVAQTFGGLGIAAGAVGVAAFYSASTRRVFVVLASFTPILLLISVVGALVLLIARRWILLALSLVVLLLGALTLHPLYVESTDSTVAGPAVNVMEANIMLGEADTTALVRQARDRNIDILTIQELTESAVGGLEAAGIDDMFPHKYLTPTTAGGGGAGIYSRYPLSNTRQLPVFLLSNLAADMQIESTTVRLYAVHPVPPFPSPTAVWAAEVGMLRTEMDSAADLDNVIVSCDFNSTYSHSQFRGLLTNGYVDAAEHTGSGLLPSYPAATSYPALLGIDHVVTKGAVATALDQIDIAGSDHHGLVATVSLNGPS